MKPTILMENEVWRKVMYWVNKSQFEVSGLGKIRVEEGGTLRVVDAMLLPQKNGHTHTDIEAEDVNRAMFMLKDSEGDLRWWWHSHVNMNVFWSSTDMDTIKKIGQGGWFAATVFNKKSEVRSATWVQEGQRTYLPWGGPEAELAPLFLDECSTKVVEFLDPKTPQWDAEYEKNVTNTPRTAVTSTGWGGWVRGPSGVYVPEFEGEYLGETAPSTGGGGIGQEALTFDFSVEPPKKRPKGMQKSLYKTWRKTYEQLQKMADREDDDAPVVLDADVDDYGFNQEDRQILLGSGWDDDDVAEMVEDHDFTPEEVLKLAQADICPRDVDYMIHFQNMTIRGIMAGVEDLNPELARGRMIQ
jgi:hypothetical protein